MWLEVERTLPAPPAAVWPLLHDPARMNRWSEASVELLREGDQGLPWGVGALRRVTVPLPLGRTGELLEVVSASEPPERLVYQVLDAPGLRSHRGELRLQPAAGGTRLRWTVDAVFATKALGMLARRTVGAALERSLVALGEAVRHAAPATLRPSRFEEPTPLEDLYRAAERSLAEQRELHQELARREDPRQWFAQAYVLTTEAQLAGAREGAVQHTGWVLRLIPAFHALYVRSLEPSLQGHHASAEAHWRSAFEASMPRNGRKAERTRALVAGLLAGVRAHVEEDLPRALAMVYVEHYRAACDYARFRADFLLMGPLFVRATESLVAKMPREMVPWYAGPAGRVLPFELREALRRRNYNMTQQRRVAFDRGERIAALLTARP